MCVRYSATFLAVVVFLLISLATSLKIIPARSRPIFPRVRDETDFEPKISADKCKRGQTFCEYSDSYPYHLLQGLNNEGQYKYLFGIDEVPLMSDRSDLTEFVCSSKSLLVFPKVALNTKKKWRFVVNQGKGREQGIRVEMCVREGSSCKISTRELVKTSCKQKYGYRRLLAVSENGTLETDSFLLPVACCCSIIPKINWNPVG